MVLPLARGPSWRGSTAAGIDADGDGHDDDGIDRRTVISLTTSPKRLRTIEPTLKSLLSQTFPADRIQINLPRLFKRDNSSFPVDVLQKYSFLNNPVIRIHWCLDVGPITKLVPTLASESYPETVVILVDDDTIYPDYMVGLIKESLTYDPSFAIGGHCGDVRLHFPQPSPATSNFTVASGKSGNCCCQMLEGFGAIGFRRALFNNLLFPFMNYLDIALKFPECYRADDFVIANYFAMNKYRGIEVEIMVRQIRSIGRQADALHRQDRGGFEVTYPRCSQYLQRHNLSYIEARTYTT
jgi:hypothetical protein